MKKNISLFLAVVLLLSFGFDDIYAQVRPALRPLNEKKLQAASQGLYPLEKKGKWGYADAAGKFIIRPVFVETMQMGASKVGFVSYLNQAGAQVWTLLDFKGNYLTELEFDAVVADFDDRGLAVVMKDGRYGMLNTTGQLFVECIFSTYLERGPVRLLRTSSSSDWAAVVKDDSSAGVSVYTFAGNEPIILKAEGGYGIISPRNQSVVADFEYESVFELIPGSVYCLQKAPYKFLYADDKLSAPFEDVIPAADNAYFVVKQDGIYGILNQYASSVVDCKYTTYLNYGTVELLHSPSLDECEVVVKDSSAEGYTVHSYSVNENIIVKTESGFGILDPRSQSVVAEFVYDSIDELVPGSVYCLQKDSCRYLYAADKLSAPFEDVIPAADNAYFIVKQNGLYGLVNQTVAPVVDCKYDIYKNFGLVELLYSPSSDECKVIVRDPSAGYTIHSPGVRRNIIVKTETGYGILDSRTQSVIADFVYDSVHEYVPGSVYCLQKGSDKYLYAGEKLSEQYEEVVPGPSDVYFIVRKNGLYGVLNKTGETVVECRNSICQQHGAVLLLRVDASSEWTAVAKDFSAAGFTVYTFADNDPIIVRAENGYGIISPRTHSVVADFVYDSVQEYVSGSVYCLQKGAYKYLYADDKLSAQNEEVIPDSDTVYFIVRQGGLYGVLDIAGNVVVECLYTTCLNHGKVLLLQSASLPQCVVVVKDSSATGYSVQSYDADQNVIVKTENGYGMLNPRSQSILADFIYDSIQEYMPGSVYCLQKDGYNYLHADGQLSAKYDEILSSAGNDCLIVRQNGLYGVVDMAGKTLADCAYSIYLERGPVMLLRVSEATGWDVLVKEESGYGVYSFAADQPLIVKVEGVYGIISQKDQSVVADFVYDSIQEYVPGHIYCLQKGDHKCLCIDEVMSNMYEDVIPGADNEYYVVRENGMYGVLTPEFEMLLPCSQTEVPVLLKDEYTRFYVDGVPVYVKVGGLISATEYDDYIYEKYKTCPADYLLDETLAFDLKKYVGQAVHDAYGTPGFERIMGLEQAVKYAESRKFILLSADDRTAKYLDLETGSLRETGDVVYHAFPSKEGYPMYASALRNGKFGIIDIRNCAVVIPFEYDRICPVGENYVLMYVSEDPCKIFLYNVTESLMVTPEPCESVSLDLLSNGYVSVRQTSKERIYNLKNHSWLLPEDHYIEQYVHLPGTDACAVFAKNGSKGALFSLQTGEQLTDYIFDDVAKEIVCGKYHLVTVDGKQDLYDLSNRQYFLPCSFERINAYHKYRRNEYVVISAGKMCGLYNVKKEKLLLPMKYDEIILKGAYAQVRQGKSSKIYSLMKNDIVNLGLTYDYIELLDDGYALMFSSASSGVYDINRSKWQFSFGKRTRKDFAAGEFHDLGDNLLFIPGFGVLNYLTCSWQVRADMKWANWASRSGDHVTVTGGFEGETKLIYSMKRDRVLMNYDRTYQMWPLSDSRYLKDEYVVLHSYGCHAGASQTDESGEYKAPDWLPWNDEEGGAGLYDVDKKSWLFANEKGLDYFGAGLLYVVDKGIYDLVLKGWVLNTDAVLDYFKEADNLFVETKDADGQTKCTYWFDTDARALVPMTETFSIYDYAELKNVNGAGRYNPKVFEIHWKLYDSQENDYVPAVCDRISLMHEE